MSKRSKVSFSVRVERWKWFWDDVIEASADLVTSRRGLMFLGNAAVLPCAVAGLVYFWSRPMTFEG
ncbi:hypothetical protein [Streptomyces capitiformicae]|uniref:Uncharacterized protein n=1 Tax=Streptomyces capitiformicae TaxID=2014920 RepID=A0A919DPQ5_9ACTN|nr:hypothetical protein [Streptomyces capitiformicae]GHE69308.1 hypothetical protein GCM10017771_93090 [Streptomyces capitiformicae]